MSLYAIAFSFLFQVNAQDAVSKNAQMTQEQRMEMHLNRLKEKLNLTPDQVSKVKDLLVANEAMRKSNDKEAMKESHAKMSFSGFPMACARARANTRRQCLASP